MATGLAAMYKKNSNIIVDNALVRRLPFSYLTQGWKQPPFLLLSSLFTLVSFHGKKFRISREELKKRNKYKETQEERDPGLHTEEYVLERKRRETLTFWLYYNDACAWFNHNIHLLI